MQVNEKFLHLLHELDPGCYHHSTSSVNHLIVPLVKTFVLEAF